jgi:hypothetical protein
MRPQAAPTTRVLLAAGTLVSSLFWAGSGAVYRMRAFPMLNLPVHEPARPGPAHPLVRAAPYAENRSAGMATTYLIVIRHANAFLPGLAPAWRPRHQADLEAFMADCSPVGRPAPPPPSTRPSRSTSGCSLVRSATTAATPLPHHSAQRKHPWCLAALRRMESRVLPKVMRQRRVRQSW